MNRINSVKKIGIAVCVLMLTFAFVACGHQTENTEDGQNTTEVVNPIAVVSYEELLAKTGIAFALPDGAENAAYSIINGDEVIAQMTFVLDGVNCTCRGQSAPIPEDGVIPDISGMYFQWEKTVEGEVFYSDALFQYIPGKAGVVNWYDYAPGILYSVSVDANAAEVFLRDLAEKTCPLLQGEAVGEDVAEAEASPRGDAPEIDGADLAEIAQ